MTIQERLESLKNDANVKVVGKFQKSMPTLFDADSILAVGDYIVFPEVMPEVRQRVFGKDKEGKDIIGEFIVVEVKHEGKETRAIDFYPSSLTKAIWPSQMNEDGEVELVNNQPIFPKGTAVELYTSARGKSNEEGESDVQIGMTKLLGKTVHVADTQLIDIQVFRNGERINQLKQTNLFTYNLA